jgi:hypothetical protein
MKNNIIMNLSVESCLLRNKPMQNCYGPWWRYMSGIIQHVYVPSNLSKVMFLKLFSRVKALIQTANSLNYTLSIDSGCTTLLWWPSFACKCFKYFLISSGSNNVVRNLMTRFHGQFGAHMRWQKETRVCDPQTNKLIRIEPKHKWEKWDVQGHEQQQKGHRNKKAQ